MEAIRHSSTQKIGGGVRKRLRIPCLAFVLFTLGAFPLQAGAETMTNAPSFDGANSSFAAGNYRDAISQYEVLIERNGYSAPLLFNLGNACYRAGEFGRAILNYERAQVLAPNDESINSNLRLACEKAGVKEPATNPLLRAARLLTPNALAWTGSAALAAICLAIFMRRVRPRFAPARPLTGLALAVLLAVIAAFAVRWPEFNRAVVVAVEAPARIAPASNAAESFRLKGGEPVSAEQSHGDFVLIRTPDGRSGWVSRDEIGLLFGSKTNQRKSA